MLIKDLAAHKTIESAAKEFAGNWTKWNHFVWFGASDVPHSDQFLLGYIVNHEGGNQQETELRIVRNRLAPYYGDVRQGKHAGPYGADYCGDKNLLSGVMVRVIGDDGKPTAAFKTLYETARYLTNTEKDSYTPADRAIYNEVNARYFRQELLFYLQTKGNRPKIPMIDDLLEKVVGYLAEEDYDEVYADGKLDEKIKEAIREVKKS